MFDKIKQEVSIKKIHDRGTKTYEIGKIYTDDSSTATPVKLLAFTTGFNSANIGKIKKKH